MKNKQIIDSINKILPDDTTRKLILNNIISGKKRTSLNFKKIIPVMCCFLFIIISSFYFNQNRGTSPVVVNKAIYNQIIYNGNCYMEKGTYDGDKKVLEFIEYSKEFIMGEEIYKKGNSIVFKNNENYIEFERCGGE